MSFVDFFQGIADGTTGVRGKSVYVVADRRKGRAYDLKVFIDDLGWKGWMEIHAPSDALA